jgi:hypothetical protein
MQSNVLDTIVDLVRQANPELTARLAYQAEALREAECTNSLFGRWVDANDVKYLLSTFALGDREFAERFPSMTDITEQGRKRVLAALETHIGQCKHCSLKQGFDLELDAYIKKVCKQNDAALLQLLREKAAEEVECQGLTPATAVSTP